MATRNGAGTIVASDVSISGDKLVTEMMKKFSTEQRRKEEIKKFGENLTVQMEVLSEVVKDFSDLYRKGVIAAMTDSTTLEHIEVWLQTVKDAFENKSGQSGAQFTSFCPKKGEMSEDEYNVYAIGYLTALDLHSRIINDLLITLNLGN